MTVPSPPLVGGNRTSPLVWQDASAPTVTDTNTDTDTNEQRSCLEACGHRRTMERAYYHDSVETDVTGFRHFHPRFESSAIAARTSVFTIVAHAVIGGPVIPVRHATAYLSDFRSVSGPRHSVGALRFRSAGVGKGYGRASARKRGQHPIASWRLYRRLGARSKGRKAGQQRRAVSPRAAPGRNAGGRAQRSGVPDVAGREPVTRRSGGQRAPRRRRRAPGGRSALGLSRPLRHREADGKCGHTRRL